MVGGGMDPLLRGTSCDLRHPILTQAEPLQPGHCVGDGLGVGVVYLTVT